MSYEIIKSIKITEDKVFITGASNNVRPRWYEEFECKSLSKLLQEKGKEEVELEIFKEYENGNFQKGNNKFVRALTVLKHLPEYKEFDWRGEPYKEICDRRETKEFEDILRKALNTYLPKEKYIVFKEVYNGQIQYLYKITKRYAKWTRDKARAKVFRYKEDAEDIKRYFYNSDCWEVERIK